jgi:hypothetical protein
MKKALKTLAIGGALAASVIGFSPAAQAAPAASSGGPSIQASWACNTQLYSNAVLYRPCTVYSGAIKAFIDCSNGVRYITPGGNVYLGTGSWNITLVCPSGTSRTGRGFYSIG